MIFSVQKNNLTYSLEFLPELLTTKVSSQSLGFFFGSNWCFNSSVSHDRNLEERLHWTTPDAGSHHPESVWNNGNDVTDWRTKCDELFRASRLQHYGSTYNRFPLSLRIIRICGEPNYNPKGWGGLWAKDFIQRTINTSTGDGLITSFALHCEFAKHFCCSTSYSIRKNENIPFWWNDEK